MTKICTKCFAEKELDEFPKAKLGKYGRRTDCRLCRKAYLKVHYKAYYAKNRTEKIAKVMAYEATHKEAIKVRKQVWNLTPERLEHERIRGKLRRQDPAHKRRHAFLVRNYYARKEKALGYCSKASLEARWNYYGHRCWICSEPARETDHVKPLTKGGTNWPANLRPICRSCNARKSNVWPYIKQLERTIYG